MFDSKEQLAQIEKRYNALATVDVNLSCGSSFDFANPKIGEKCLDLGSGRGKDVLKLANAVGKDGFVYGVDASLAMVENARNTAILEEKTNVEFIHSDLKKINVADNSIDLIISNCALNHASDKLAVWNEIFRVLKNQGRFVISDIYSLEEIPNQFKNDPCAVAGCWAGAVTKSEYLNTILKSGFSKLEIIKESTPYEKHGIMLSSFTILGKKHIV